MSNSTDEAISFEELDKIFMRQLELNPSLEQLELLSELLGATTNSHPVCQELFSQMYARLEEKNDASLFLTYSDHPNRLDQPQFEEKFIVRALELTTDPKELIYQEPKYNDGLPPPKDAPKTLVPILEKLILQTIEEFEKAEEDPFADRASLAYLSLKLIGYLHRYSKNPLRAIELLLKILDLYGDEEFQMDATEKLLFWLEEGLRIADLAIVRGIFEVINGKIIHPDSQSDLDHLVDAYRKAMER